MRALLVEDEPTVLHSVAGMLRSEKIVVDTAEAGEEALELLRHYEYDILVLDVLLPDMDGFDVVRRMRAARIDVPVLLLSSLGRPQARVKGFALGADDFVTKPFDRAELLARVQAVVRRSKGYSHPVLRIGNTKLDLDAKEVFVGDTPLHLTGKEYLIFELLALRKGAVLSKEAFLNHLYGGIDEPEIKIIDVFICKLRKKLVTAGSSVEIGTVWGRGYVLRDPEAGRSARPLSTTVAATDAALATAA
jgi:two-component system cell cycle response regulator CtrA